jgi:Methyltransferase domain
MQRYGFRAFFENFQRLPFMVRNVLLDLKYGGILRGGIKTRFANLGAHDTGNTDYSVLPLIFEGLIGSSDVLVDVGCGKGRVINWWLSQGLRNPIYGVELDEKIAAKTRRRLRLFKNVSIMAGDVTQHIPADGTIFYLYNPFNAAALRKFRDRMKVVFGDRPGIKIVYYNPVELHVFREDARWIVHERKLPTTWTWAHDLAIIELAPAPESSRR